MASIEINKPAPDFSIMDYKGILFRLSEFKGAKNILLVLNRGFA